MTATLLNNNLSALKHHKMAYDIVNKLLKRHDASKYVIEQSKSNDPFLIFKENTDKSIAYHSRYNPKREAVKQAESTYENQTHAIILGFGLGYLAEEIRQRLPTGTNLPRLFIIEPDPYIFIAALNCRNLTDFLNDSRVNLSVGIGADEVGEQWNSLLDWTSLENLAIVDHPPSMSRFKQYFERVIEKIRYLCNRSKGNLVTIMHAGTEFQTNYFSNLADSFFMPGVNRLFNKFQNVPAIIVAAGPSLDKNVQVLKKIKGKFPIIAVDTALRQLISHNIKPDIVCAADPSYENSLDFVGVENETDVILAIEAMTHPDIISSFQGPKMLMTFGGGLQGLIKDFREPVGQLVCWGSIATTVFDFAKKLGCNPLVFVGLDLSFQDGKLHARGSYSDDLMFDKLHRFTSIENETEEYINTHGAYKIIREDGTTVFTDHNMKLYKDWFEDQFRQTSQRVINATEGGVVEKYVEIMNLEQVYNTFESQSTDVAKILKQALKGNVVANLKGLIDKLNFTINELRQSDSMVRRVLANTKKLLSVASKKHPDNLSGPQKELFFEILKFHDSLCNRKETFAWFSIQKAKFMTKHTMIVNSLKLNKQALSGDWMNEMKDFFDALLEFHEFQIPILDKTIYEMKNKINRQNKSKSLQEVGT